MGYRHIAGTLGLADIVQDSLFLLSVAHALHLELELIEVPAVCRQRESASIAVEPVVIPLDA